MALEDLAYIGCKTDRTLQSLFQSLQHFSASKINFHSDWNRCVSASPAWRSRTKSQPGQSLADKPLHPRPRIWDWITLLVNRPSQHWAGLRCALCLRHLHLPCDCYFRDMVVLLVEEGAGDHDLGHKWSHFDLRLEFTEWIFIQYQNHMSFLYQKEKMEGLEKRFVSCGINTDRRVFSRCLKIIWMTVSNRKKHLIYFSVTSVWWNTLSHSQCKNMEVVGNFKKLCKICSTARNVMWYKIVKSILESACIEEMWVGEILPLCQRLASVASKNLRPKETWPAYDRKLSK